MSLRAIGISALTLAVAGNLAAQQPAPPAPKPTATHQAAASAPPAGPMKAVSLGLVPYPAKKQPAHQQSKDDQECYDWSKQSTGIDPTQPVAVQQSAEAQPQKGTRLKGAAKGAAAGDGPPSLR